MFVFTGFDATTSTVLVPCPDNVFTSVPVLRSQTYMFPSVGTSERVRSLIARSVPSLPLTTYCSLAPTKQLRRLMCVCVSLSNFWTTSLRAYQ